MIQCLVNVLKYHQVNLFPQRLITPSLIDCLDFGSRSVTH